MLELYLYSWNGKYNKECFSHIYYSKNNDYILNPMIDLLLLLFIKVKYNGANN